MMTSNELVSKAVDVAKNYKTLYVMGCFGAPLNKTNKARYSKNNAYNKDPKRVAMINAASGDIFGFDCVCFVKGLLWGWNGNKSKVYGGATYASNGVPDIGTEGMIGVCKEVSTNFSNIVSGAFVWMQGHCGIYIGDGLVVESSPKWKNGVQITALGNLGSKPGYNSRVWTKWGKLPYVDYASEEGNLEIMFNGSPVKVTALNKDNQNYIRMVDLDKVLHIGKVSYENKMPTLKTK